MQLEMDRRDQFQQDNHINFYIIQCEQKPFTCKVFCKESGVYLAERARPQAGTNGQSGSVITGTSSKVFRVVPIAILMRKRFSNLSLEL